MSRMISTETRHDNGGRSDFKCGEKGRCDLTQMVLETFEHAADQGELPRALWQLVFLDWTMLEGGDPLFRRRGDGDSVHDFLTKAVASYNSTPDGELVKLSRTHAAEGLPLIEALRPIVALLLRDRIAADAKWVGAER